MQIYHILGDPHFEKLRQKMTGYWHNMGNSSSKIVYLNLRIARLAWFEKFVQVGFGLIRFELYG